MADLTDIYGSDDIGANVDACCLDMNEIQELNGLKILGYNIGGIGDKNYSEIETLLNFENPRNKIQILHIYESWMGPKSKRK